MLYLRMTSITVSSMVLTVLAFLAMTQKFGLILDDFIPSKPIVVVTKRDPVPPPPPPPPVKIDDKIVPPEIMPSFENATIVHDPVGEPQLAPPPAPSKITGATWLTKPGAREFDRYYPSRAQEREKEGRVVLNCAVNADGYISCAVASETPEGWGFGEAAIQIAKSFRMAPKTINGEPTSGGTISVPIAFRLGG